MSQIVLEKTTSNGNLHTYAELRRRVKETLLLGQQRIEAEKVRTYWETGNHIHKHILFHKERADYGKEVIVKLSEDLDISDRLLYQCMQVYRYLKILHRGAESSIPPLSWSHLRTLVRINNKDKQQWLMQRAIKEGWTAQDLSLEIKRINARHLLPAANSVPLIPKRGTLYAYRIIQPESVHREGEDLFIDQGFACNRLLASESAIKFKAGDIVLSKKIADGKFKLEKADLKEDALFTYYGYVQRVVDGDTLRIKVDLGFDNWTRQYLRLRGIDCPEMNTLAGKRARDFVLRELEKSPYIVLQSSRSDKFDRYLADVFYQSKDGTEKYLNQELINHGHAQRIRE